MPHAETNTNSARSDSGQALFLYQSGDCETYLYVEQQNGARLAIFNITDPAKIACAVIPANAAVARFVWDRSRRLGEKVAITHNWKET
jgi:hypothetical protein